MSQCATILKRLMLKENLTESELARRTGIGQPVIHRISSGETDNPKIDTLLPIANYFSLDLSELVGDHPLPGKQFTSAAADALPTWCKVPLLSWEQIPHWLQHHQPLHPIRYIATHHQLSPGAYAVTLADNSLEPRFCVGTHFMIEPQREPKHNDFCIILEAKHRLPVIYQLRQPAASKNPKKTYVPVNPLFETKTVEQDADWQCLGVAVQAIVE